MHGQRRYRVRNRKINLYISYLCFVSSQVSKYLQTLALDLIMFMLCLPKTLHGCTVYVGLGSGTKKSTYISYNYVLLHGLCRSRVQNRKTNIYLLYLCFVSSKSEQAPTDSSSRSYHIYAMSPENPEQLHGLHRSRVWNKKINTYLF